MAWKGDPPDMSRQRIGFATAPDSVRIAYATSGRGPALVRAPHWISHVERDWASPVWEHWFTALSERHTLIRYDQRGNGLSDRAVREQSLEAWLGDLEAVVDAAELDRFALLGACQGAAISVAYAVRHPERVSALVLYGAYARGRRLRGPVVADQNELLETLIRLAWGQSDSPFRQAYANLFVPDAGPDLASAMVELQRASVTAEEALRSSTLCAGFDITELAGQVRTPTLVLHLRDDAAVPFEEGRSLAALIPGSRFVPLDGRNHLLLPGEPAWSRFLAEVEAFLAPDPGPATSPIDGYGLTGREHEVLALVAHGRSNEQIATRLCLSVRTVERHLSNVYAKLGVNGKSARAAAAVATMRLR